MPQPMQISAVERATVIAALRLWQRALEENQDFPPNDLFMTATASGRWEPLGVAEVEKIIGRILIFNTLSA